MGTTGPGLAVDLRKDFQKLPRRPVLRGQRGSKGGGGGRVRKARRIWKESREYYHKNKNACQNTSPFREQGRGGSVEKRCCHAVPLFLPPPPRPTFKISGRPRLNSFFSRMFDRAINYSAGRPTKMAEETFGMEASRSELTSLVTCN